MARFGDVILDGVIKDEADSVAGAAGVVFLGPRGAVVAVVEAAECAFEDEVELGEEFLFAHVGAHGCGAELHEGLVDFGPCFQCDAGGSLGVHHVAVEDEMVARDELDVGIAHEVRVVREAAEAVLRVANRGLGADEVGFPSGEGALGAEELVALRVEVDAGFDLVGKFAGFFEELQLLEIRDARGVEAPVGAGDFLEVAFALPDEFGHRDFGVDFRDLYNRAVVADACAFEERLDDVELQCRARLRIRDEVNGVIVRAGELLGDGDFGAGDELFADARFERPLVLFEAIRAAGGEGVADRLVFAVEHRGDECIRIKRAFCLLNPCFANEREIGENADLVRIPDRPDVKIFERDALTAGLAADGLALSANPPRRKIPRHFLRCRRGGETAGLRWDARNVLLEISHQRLFTVVAFPAFG